MAIKHNFSFENIFQIGVKSTQLDDQNTKMKFSPHIRHTAERMVASVITSISFMSYLSRSKLIELFTYELCRTDNKIRHNDFWVQTIVYSLVD